MISPDSPLLCFAAGALALGFIGTAIWALLRRRLLASVGAILAASIFAIGLVGARLNSVNHFYPTWDAILGADGENYAERNPLPLPARDAFSVANPAYKTNFSPITDPETLGDSPQGEYLATEFRGPVSGFSQTVRVWAPTGWQEMHNLQVLVFLHGYPSAPQRAPQQLDIGRTMTSLIAAGTIPPAIVVFPTTLVPGSEPTCVDVTGGPATGTWAVREVPTMIAANFPVSTAATDWTLAGYSYGGYCAGVLGALAQDTFHQVFLFGGFDSPIYPPLNRPKYADTYRVSTQFAAAHPFRIYAPVVTRDPDTQELATALSGIVQDQDVLVTPVNNSGGHNWKTVRAELRSALKWHGGVAPEKSISGNYAPPEASAAAHDSTADASLVITVVTLSAISCLAVLAVFRGWRKDTRCSQISAAIGTVLIPITAALGALLAGAIATGVVTAAADLPALLNLLGI